MIPVLVRAAARALVVVFAFNAGAAHAVGVGYGIVELAMAVVAVLVVVDVALDVVTERQLRRLRPFEDAAAYWKDRALDRAQATAAARARAIELQRHLDGEVWEGPMCRVCGCTDDYACPGGCWWVPDPAGLGDLCSACLPPQGRAA